MIELKIAKTSGFRWLPSFYDALRNLPDEDRLKIYDAILDFGFGNEPEELPPLLTGYYQLIRPIIEKSARFYDKQKENGSKGGRKPKHNPNETESGLGLNVGLEKEKPTEDLDSESEVDSEKDNEAAKKADKPSRTRFVPPNLEDVTAYCQQRRNTVDPQRFIDYYEANGWVQGKGKPIRDWRAAVRTWERTGRQKQPTRQQTDLSWRDSRSITIDDMVEYPEGSGQYRPRWEVPHD